VTGEEFFTLQGPGELAMRLFQPDAYQHDEQLRDLLRDFTETHRAISNKQFTETIYKAHGLVGIHVTYINFTHHRVHSWYLGGAGSGWRVETELPGTVNDPPAAMKAIIDSMRIHHP
jgi:hypothetical protein